MRQMAASRSGSWAIALTALVLVAAVSTACSSSPAEVSPTPASAVPTVSAASPVPAPPKGREVFRANCATCHGVDAAGQPDWHISNPDGTLPPPPLNGDGHTWHHGDGLLYRVVKLGGQQFEDPRFPDFKSAMPAFGDQLTHEEIIEVLTYIKSLWEGKTSRGTVHPGGAGAGKRRSTRSRRAGSRGLERIRPDQPPLFWIPAFAGMTVPAGNQTRAGYVYSSRPAPVHPRRHADTGG